MHSKTCDSIKILYWLYSNEFHTSQVLHCLILLHTDVILFESSWNKRAEFCVHCLSVFNSWVECNNDDEITEHRMEIPIWCEEMGQWTMWITTLAKNRHQTPFCSEPGSKSFKKYLLSWEITYRGQVWKKMLQCCVNLLFPLLIIFVAKFRPIHFEIFFLSNCISYRRYIAIERNTLMTLNISNV